MAKIKNMGTATMRFKEGLYVSGSVYQEDGSYGDFALVVTGSAVFDNRDGASGNSGGITLIKDEQDPVFIRFINDDDPTSWYAFIAMDSAENFYISPGRSQDFYIITRENSGANYYYPFRIFDNGKIKFHQAAQSSSDAQTELPADVVFSVSGSNSGTEGVSVFGGNVVISGSNTVEGDLEISQYIRHIGDSNTNINFTDDKINLKAGNISMITMEEKSSAPHEVRINNGGNNIDFNVEDNSGNIYFTADASTSRVGIGTETPSEKLTINTANDADEVFMQFQEAGSDRAKIGVNSSNNLVLHQQYTNKHIVFKVNDQGVTREGFRIDGAVPEVVVNEGSESLVDFRVEGDNKTHMVFVDGSFDLLVLGSDQAMPPGIGQDTNVFVSGSKDGQGQTVVGGNMVVSGSFSAIQKHVVNLKYTATSDANKKYVRFGSNGSNDNPGVNNKFVPPVQGNLLQAVIRSTGTPGNTTLGFHRATDGTEDIPTNAIETQSVNLSSANTSAFVNFTHAANFGPGDIVGFSVDPTNNHGNVNITLVFELDFAS